MDYSLCSTSVPLVVSVSISRKMASFYTRCIQAFSNITISEVHRLVMVTNLGFSGQDEVIPGDLLPNSMKLGITALKHLS